MKREELDELWQNPANWRWYGYVCKDDPRVIVRKRVQWLGWTFNFAHPVKAWTLGILILFVALIPLPIFIFAISKGVGLPIIILASNVLGIVVVLFTVLTVKKRKQP